MNFPSLSVVLPAFNEATNLPQAVAMLSRALSGLGVDYEIIVVNDGSTDETATLCQKLARSETNLRLVSHPKNLGYGAALRTGFDRARYDFIYFTDADGQFKAGHLPEFLGYASSADAVIGYRASRSDTKHRIVFSRIGNWMAREAFGLTVRDINCAAKLLRRTRLVSLRLSSNGAMINTELLYRAGQEGWRVVEVPVDHFPRQYGDATGANLAVLWRTLLEFARLACRGAERIPNRSRLPNLRESADAAIPSAAP